MKIGSTVKVKSDHKFHANRQGVINFFGTEESAGVVVLSDPNDSKTVFAVKLTDLEKV